MSLLLPWDQNADQHIAEARQYLGQASRAEDKAFEEVMVDGPVNREALQDAATYYTAANAPATVALAMMQSSAINNTTEKGYR